MTPRRKKVLFLIPSLTGGGAERVFSMLLRNLDRSYFELHLAVLQSKGAAFAEDIPKDVVVHDLKTSRVRYALPSIVRLVWKIRPHTILSTLAHLNLALILGKPLLPRTTRLLVREATIVSTFLSEETRHPQLWGWFYRHLYKRADKVVCLSDAMINDMVENFKLPREKLVRIYNPVDIEWVRELARIGGNPFWGPGPHIIAAGRFSKEKGFDLLLDAMPAVLKQLPDAQLTILGEGPLLAELMKQVKRLGLTEMVHFLGFQQNPWRYFGHADLFVLSSRYEGLPNALLEALAVGTPVVATDCQGAVREILDPNGQMILVSPEDPTALADAIISVCKRRRNCLDRLEKSRLPLSKFNLQQIVGEYSSIF